MTKTLTEQFMDNELDDRLYYFTQKMSQDKVEIGHSFEFNMVRADDGEYLDWFLIHEVLAPVPSFDEYKELVRKSDKLDKLMSDTVTNQGDCQQIVEDNLNRELSRKTLQLEIATKALKEIFYERDERAVGDYLWIANNALKEMEGVK